MHVPVLINPECEHFRQVEEAIRIIESRQRVFQLSIIKEDWLPNDENKRRLRPERIQRLVDNSIHCDKPSIAVIENRFSDDAFSYEYRYLHIISMADWESQFAPPPLVVYLTYQFAGALLKFAADLPYEVSKKWEHRNPPIGCYFDTFIYKNRIRLGMIGANLCGDHEVKLIEMGLPNQALQAIEQILLYVREATIRRPRDERLSVFIGHGHSKAWIKLRDYLTRELGLEVDEFNQDPVAGITTADRLKQMLNRARLAFLVMTPEHRHPDETFHARENVIHEIGLFQGGLGFDKAIIVREEGTEDFSNVHGYTYIDFKKNRFGMAKNQIRQTLEREGLVQPRKKSSSNVRRKRG